MVVGIEAGVRMGMVASWWGRQGKLLTSAVPSRKPWRMAPTEKEEEGAIVPVMRWRGRA